MPPKRSSVPDLGAVKIPTFTCRQSRYPHAPQLPCLAIAQASSMGGKSNLLVKLLTEVWRHEDGKSCFSRIYVFSPSVTVDPIWRPVKEMIEEEILDMRNPNHANEKFFYDEPDMEALQNILDQQFAIIELSRRKKRREEPQIAIILDDLSADPRFIRNNKLLHVLYTRGRHAKITTITSVHKSNIVAPIVRAQATALFVFRQKSAASLAAFIEENSANVGKEVLEKVYKLATAEPFQFLYVNLRATDVNEMFYIGFKQRIRITDASAS